MFSNYIKTAWRNLLRHKMFSGLNIIGLATGMACSILIFLWVQDELSFDRFNPNADRISRLVVTIIGSKAPVVPSPLANAIQTQIPQIKMATKIVRVQKVISAGTKRFDEKRMYYADSNFLRMFHYPLLKGNASTVFSSPVNTVITETTAKKYFGDAAAAMGKTVYIDNDIRGTTLIIAGVLKDIPANSHLQFDVLLPISLYERTSSSAWSNFDVFTYIELQEAAAKDPSVVASVESQANEILRKNSTEVESSLTLQPLTSIHLHSAYILDVPGQSNSQYVYIFSLVAVFIIVIACINFMNLATAISGRRAKEIGLKKTVGAIRGQLIVQFFCESLLVAAISLLIGIVLVYLLLPFFNQLTGKSITFSPIRLNILPGLAAIAILTGLLSGAYPAFFLSSFNPIKALKGTGTTGNRKSFLRSGLVIMQFAISVILIICTIVVFRQLKYIQNRDIGFQKESLVYLKTPDKGDLKNNKDAMHAALAKFPDISNFTFTDELPTDLTSASLFKWPGMPPGSQISANRLRVDENFVQTFGIKMAAGHFFSKEFGTDASAYVINETAAKAMGLTPEKAIGKLVSISLEDKEAPVIGVVKDFNFKPVHQPVEPLVMKTNFGGGYVVMRTTPATMQKLIAELHKSFRAVYGDYPFAYGFVDQDLSNLYVSEQRMVKLFNVFAILSIVLSCLGLFGLATFATQQRTKEIGVRKVLGAGEAGIVILLSKGFIQLVALSLLIAFPVAAWAMNSWLNGFAYRTNLSWWIFAVAGFGCLIITLLTISFQSVQAALTNPAKSLRTE